MDHLEDTPRFELAHAELDNAGRLARTNFPIGCQFEIEDESNYFVTCPVSLAHNRVGLSTGMIVREAECSICHVDPEDCIHITGRIYDGQRCIRIIKRADILEVSLVARPNLPDARITRLSLNVSDIAKKLGPRFRPGMPVLCDRCLSDCHGVRDNFGKLSGSPE